MTGNRPLALLKCEKCGDYESIGDSIVICLACSDAFNFSINAANSILSQRTSEHDYTLALEKALLEIVTAFVPIYQLEYPEDYGYSKETAATIEQVFKQQETTGV